MLDLIIRSLVFFYFAFCVFKWDNLLILIRLLVILNFRDVIDAWDLKAWVNLLKVLNALIFY